MKRAFVFARRNIKETLRSPVSWEFGLALPIAIFVIMQIIVKSSEKSRWLGLISAKKL